MLSLAFFFTAGLLLPHYSLAGCGFPNSDLEQCVQERYLCNNTITIFSVRRVYADLSADQKSALALVANLGTADKFYSRLVRHHTDPSNPLGTGDIIRLLRSFVPPNDPKHIEEDARHSLAQRLCCEPRPRAFLCTRNQ